MAATLFWPKKNQSLLNVNDSGNPTYINKYELLLMRSRCAPSLAKLSCTKLMCSIVIRDRLSVIVWRGATLSCRCLEREVSPVASEHYYLIY